MAKTAFDGAETSKVYVFRPDALRIVGGDAIRDPDERADADTPVDENDPLLVGKQARRLAAPLKEGFRENVLNYGVKAPILITKINGVPTVVEGRSRVRAARWANRQPGRANAPISIKCVLMRDPSALDMAVATIIGNEARQDTDFMQKIASMNELLRLEMSVEDVARAMCQPITTIQGLMAFDDNATPKTKQAVREGRLGPTAASELAKITDPTAQDEALGKFLVAPDKTVRAAKAARGARGASGPLVGKRNLARFLDFVRNMAHPVGAERKMAKFEGIEAILALLLGEECSDKQILRAIEDYVQEREAAEKEEAEKIAERARARAEREAARAAKDAEEDGEEDEADLDDAAGAEA